MPTSIGLEAFTEENIEQYAFCETDSEDEEIRKLRQLVQILINWYSSTTRGNLMLNRKGPLLEAAISNITEILLEYANKLSDYEIKIRAVLSGIPIINTIDPEGFIINTLLSVVEKDYTSEA